MLIVLRKDCAEAAKARVLEEIRRRGLRALPVEGPTRTAICVTGNAGPLEAAPFQAMAGVLEVVRVTKSYKLTSREVRPEDTVVRLGDVAVGGDGPPPLMAGPCSVESEGTTLAIAHALRAAGAAIFRAGAFKPRTSPYSFQGLGEKGLRILARVRRETGLPVVSEVIDAASAEAGARHLDLLQIGARNMQNFALLRVVGRLGRPVLLKRGLSATVEEWLMAAEYLMSEGARDVILCERGIRTFSTHARNTLDLSVVPLVRRLSHLPVVVDPSHGVGDRSRVLPMARAALACGAQGLLIEAHLDPDRAASDAAQTVGIGVIARLAADRPRFAGGDGSGGGGGQAVARSEARGPLGIDDPELREGRAARSR